MNGYKHLVTVISVLMLFSVLFISSSLFVFNAQAVPAPTVVTNVIPSTLTEGDNRFYRAWALDSDYYSTVYSQDEYTSFNHP